MTNPHESLPPAPPAEYDRFVRELEERLYDGCSVTFAVPHQISTSLLPIGLESGKRRTGGRTSEETLDDERAGPKG
ncbi:hypothetical protein [Alicyclobacillus tolerans]|uniref:Uncharacterized protein n=1 Tax=Alicyclobacillus tolerans TaxID=90970 RepID=A0A1M6TNU5_9BACL|nr:hypothetical protein [Alicyclobacillus montanus]SHK58610.1 hypothetical protein SAMN05443507_11729 [Alicyclobacillus montanus]